MNHSQKFSLGILIVFAALIAYALLADTAKDKGTWVWLIVALAALGLALPTVKYPGYRRLLGFLIRGGFDGVSELVSSPNPERSLDRQPVPRALRYKSPSLFHEWSQNLHVHHIDMDPGKPARENNLIALCAEHHQQAHHNREVTIPQVRSWKSRGSTTNRPIGRRIRRR